MSRPSTIDRLPEEIRELIGRLRDQGRTLDEILAHLQGLDLDEDISRSSLHRHVQKMERLGQHLKVAREQALAIVDRLGATEDNKLARLNAELLHAIILKGLAAGDDGEPAVLSPQEMMFVGRALAQVAAAQKVDVDRAVTIREKLRKDDAKKLAEVEGELAAEGGAPAERARAALSKVRELLGVPDVAA